MPASSLFFVGTATTLLRVGDASGDLARRPGRIDLHHCGGRADSPDGVLGRGVATLRQGSGAAYYADPLPDLRHHSTSLLIRHGESVKTVQALGRETAAETLDTYSHLSPDPDDRTREAVDAALGNRADSVRTEG
jgi:hypothetical protein